MIEITKKKICKTHEVLEEFAKHWQDDMSVLHFTTSVFNGMNWQFRQLRLFTGRVERPDVTDSQQLSKHQLTESLVWNKTCHVGKHKNKPMTTIGRQISALWVTPSQGSSEPKI